MVEPLRRFFRTHVDHVVAPAFFVVVVERCQTQAIRSPEAIEVNRVISACQIRKCETGRPAARVLAEAPTQMRHHVRELIE
eukprot:5317335-Pleurochrysis_carterae.AAC.1